MATVWKMFCRGPGDARSGGYLIRMNQAACADNGGVGVGEGFRNFSRPCHWCRHRDVLVSPKHLLSVLLSVHLQWNPKPVGCYSFTCMSRYKSSFLCGQERGFFLIFFFSSNPGSLTSLLKFVLQYSGADCRCCRTSKNSQGFLLFMPQFPFRTTFMVIHFALLMPTERTPWSGFPSQITHPF